MPPPQQPPQTPPVWVLEEDAASRLDSPDNGVDLACCEAAIAYRTAHPGCPPLMVLMHGDQPLAVEEVDPVAVASAAGVTVPSSGSSPTFDPSVMASYPQWAVAHLIVALRQADPEHPALRGTRECSLAVETLVRTVISALPEVATQGTRAKLRNALLAMGVRGL